MIGRPTAVHQFHPGTAEGDAITQQLLSVRTHLRGLGYRSEVYALHIPRTLRSEIRPFSTHRGSANQVLLLHHSIGNDAFTDVLALPDSKILCYHNITPEEYFESEVIRAAIRLGRAQLRRMPDVVGAAIADSNFNRRDLLAHGFDVVDVLPVQTRFEKYASNQARSARSHDWLSVGRVVASKCLHDIVLAFGVYAAAFDRTARLHLVGDISDRPYVTELRQLAAAMHVADRLVVWGKLSESQLVERYQHAGVYVCLSEHEGFGVPLLEAMAARVPVVAYASTAIPETLAGAGIQVQIKDPSFIAGLVHALLDDADLTRRLLDRQDQRIAQLARFDIDAVLERAIARCRGDRLPLRVQIQGPFETSYSLATVNRELALALDRTGSLDVSIYATEGPGDYVPAARDLRVHPGATRLYERSATVPYPDVTIRQLYPPRVSDAPGGLRCLYFGWEESLIPADYADAFNDYVDGIGVMSNYVRDLLHDSGVRVPIAVTGVGVDVPDTDTRNLPADLRTCKSFVFLHISSALPRKAIDVLLASYFAAFTGDDDVTLLLKTYPNPHNNVGQLLQAARDAHPNPPDVRWINEDLSREQIESLYGIASCYVHPARGEGFGLPVAEAMLARVPVIAVAHSGLTELCSEDTALVVDHRIEPANTHLSVPGSVWAEPDGEQLTELMRYVFEHVDDQTVKARLDAAAELVSTRHSWKAVAERWVELIDVLRSNASVPTVSLVTTWNSRCGIAEYSSHLARGIGPRARIEIFADTDVEPIDEMEEDTIARVWKDRWHPDLSELTQEVLASASDVVHIQFNFGFFELNALAAFIERVSVEKPVIITFHATKDTMIDGRMVSLREIAGSLRHASVLIVHQAADVELLVRFGLTANVRLIPQGVPSAQPTAHAQARQALQLGRRPVVATFGFLLPHKGTVELLRAIDLIRQSRPDVLLLVVCAIHPDPSSTAYRDVCLREIASLGLERNVTMINDFIPDDEARTLLAASDVVVLPYSETPESSSAALRFVLSAHRPVVATDIPIFDDAANALLRVESNDPGALAEGMQTVLDDPGLAMDLTGKVTELAEELSWDRVGQLHHAAYREAIQRHRATAHTRQAT